MQMLPGICLQVKNGISVFVACSLALLYIDS